MILTIATDLAKAYARVEAVPQVVYLTKWGAYEVKPACAPLKPTDQRILTIDANGNATI